MKSEPLIKKEVNFYAIHATESNHFVMEMMIGHKPEGSDNDINYIKFNQIRPKISIPGYEALKLFHLQLSLYAYTTNDNASKYIETKTGLKEVWDYQIRVTNGSNVLTRGHFYEKYGKFRKILSEKNNFIFDLHIVANQNYHFFKESKSESICLYLGQTLCYLLLGIETKKFGNLNSFVSQHEENLKKDKKPDQLQIQKYYKIIQTYIERKEWLPFKKDFEALSIFTCLFGLLPEAETIIIEIDSSKFFSIIANYEAHAEKFLELRYEYPVLFKILAQGIAVFFALEERSKSPHYSRYWITALKKLKIHKNLVNEIIPTFLRLASLGKIHIREDNFTDLREIQENFLLIYPKSLVFASSLQSFASMMKNDIILPKLSKLQHNEQKQVITEEEEKSGKSEKETLENNIDLPKELSDEGLNVMQDLKEILESSVEEYLKKKKDITLEEFSGFSKEIDGTPDYFQQIFSNSNTFPIMLNQTMEKPLHSTEDLSYLKSIFVEYTNSFLLSELNISEYLKNKISKDQVSTKVYYKFFQIFLTIKELSLEEFQEISSKWFEKAFNPDGLLEDLDKIYDAFLDDDEKVQMKKEFFTQKVIMLLKDSSPINKIETIIKAVKNKQALKAYEDLVQQEIQRKVEDLQTKNLVNPLLKLQGISKKYPENPLIERLISFCVNLVRSPKKEDILVSLFEKPDKNSKLFIVLTEEVFKETKILADINQICCNILEDMMDSNLEMSWISKIDKLVGEKKELFYEQFNVIIKENNIMSQNGKEQFDIAKFIQSCKDEWAGRLLLIDNVLDFFNIYCSKKEDAQKHIDSLTKIRQKTEEKNFDSFDFDSNFEVFVPYAKKLSPLKNLTSFQKYRENNNIGDDMNETCLEAAERELKQIENFKKSLSGLLDDDLATAESYFSEIRDFNTEMKLLSKILSSQESQFVLETLSYMKEREKYEKIFAGIKICIEHFNLESNSIKIIEEKCLFPSDLKLKDFHKRGNQFRELLPLITRNSLNILAEFSSSTDLIKFTIARDNKSEIDFMKEAVNEYDESHISTQTVFDFTNFWNYVMDLQKISKGKSLTEFFEGLNELAIKKLYVEIYENLRASKIHFEGIKNLYLELSHKEEAKRKQIFKIIDDSSLSFKKVKKEFDIEIVCSNKTTQNENVQTFKSIDLFELRDRAHLIVFTEQKKIDNKEVHNYQQEELDKFKSFCSFATIIYQILRILNRLSFNGYPDLVDFKVEGCKTSIVETKFTCNQSNFESLKKFKVQLEDVIEKWNECIINFYVKHYELTYLKGKNFWKVEMALNHPEEKQKYAKGLHLLHYIGKSVVKSEIDFTKSPQERLDKIGQILKSLPNIIEQKEFEPSKQKYTFYIVEIAEKFIIKGLLTLYLTIQKSIPSSFQVLLCHSFTSWNELIAFAYRCFFNPDGCLFCLIQPERLSFSLQDQFSSLVKNLRHLYPSKAFNLAFVTTNKDTHLIISLKVKNQTKTFKNAELLEDSKLVASIKGLTQNCKALTSSITGLGKTANIQKEIKQNKLNYCKFPISGTVDPISIGKRLLPILSKDRPALCFELGSILERDKSLLNEILFSMIVLKSFHYSKNVIELPKDLQIYFEINSSYFENLKDDIEIFRYLNCYNIDKMEWKDLDYLSPKIQFVCHYLKALDDKTLGKKDIHEEDIKDKILDLETCIHCLTLRFLQGRDEKYASYTQLKIFLDVLYSLFKSFSHSGFFLYSILSQSQNQRERNSMFLDDDIIAEMRLNLVEGLILAADQYTSKSVETVRSSQKYSIDSAKTDMFEKANNILSKAVVTWENSKPFTVVFTSDDSPIFVYRTLEDVPKAIWKSVENQAKALRRKAEDCLPDYRKFEQTNLTLHLFKNLVSLTTKFSFGKICQICFKKSSDSKCQACDSNSDLLSLDDNTESKQNILAMQSSKDYALTPDNFIKMLLIFMRAQQKIPIIIMGETGCGKTSLVRYLCTRILDDEFRAFPIHAGITSKMIVDEVAKYAEEAEIIQKNGRKVWVFFDEFNTTESIGLIKEIICERTMLGIELPENMVFLGACNPWRLKTQQIIFDENVGIKKKKLNEGNKRYNLLYTVHPLPETMIEFVWDYGYLDEKTEQNYIEAMIQNLELDASDKKIVVELVSKAQRKFKESEDVSSVSLRDVARYKILYAWFLNSLKTRSELKNTKKIDDKDIQKKAIVLSLLHCYYLRISSRNLRAQFLNELNSVFQKLQAENVEKLLEDEEMDFLKRMEPLPDGIAQNQALRENVFALIVCIFNKIPIFICDKPGCSKSLAIQLVFSNLRGKNSHDPYFKTLSELILVSYQGSEYCTSESILGVFNRAEKYLSVSIKNREILPVIVFDEIGLAEISENNPLKVLHNKLEIENVKVGFVGISNWRLDASKMNRALYLARPDPDMNDLKFTAEKIFESIRKDVKLEKQTIEALAKIYYDLKEDLKENRKEDMFGLRDYYFLIKGITYDLVKFANNNINKEQKDIFYHIVRKNLKKNFSGIGNEHQFMWEKFCIYMGKAEKQHQIPEPSVRDLIIDNLKDRHSRYLMIIIQSDCATEYIEQLIMQKNMEYNQYQINQNPQLNELCPQFGKQKDDREMRREVKTLIGSQMPDDLKDQSYGFKLLSDIILYMEKGYTLIFKKTDHLYSSLYDLFNQSFSSSGDKRYCRVALGALYNPKCLVHRDFHCVIYMTENAAKKADTPFLNRFEKYKLKVEDILTENERILKQELEKWVNMIIKGRNGLDLIKPESVFVNYNSEHLFNLIMKAKDELAKHEHHNEEVVLDICKRELIKAASFDFPIRVSLNVDNEEMKSELLNLYYREKETTFQSFCDKILSLNNKYTKNIVYTYTQIYDDIEYPNKDSLKELKLGNFKSETEILEEVTKYFDSNKSLLVIRIELFNESQHLLFLKHLLLNSLNDYKTKKDSRLMLIIHLQRFNTGKVVVDVLFQDWESVMIDDLNADYLLPHEFLENPQFSKLTSSKLVPRLDDIVNELFDKCLSKIRHNVDPKDQNDINNRRNKLLVNMKKNSNRFLELIKSKTLNTIAQDNNNNRFTDWRKYIIQQEWVKATAISSLEAMKLAVRKYYESYLIKVIYILEKDFLLDSYFLALRSNDENIIKIWSDCFERVKIQINRKLDDQLIEIESIFGLRFPFSVYEEPKIIQIQEEAEERANNYESDLLEKISLDNLTESSFFGEKLPSEILPNKKIFMQYFNDQLLLHLRRIKLNIKVEVVSELLDYMFMGDQIAKLKYFLTSIKEFNLILGVLEALFTLPKGHLILTGTFKGFLNLNIIQIDKVDAKDLPKHLLVFKDGHYYILRHAELTKLQKAEGDMTDFNEDDSKRPFIYFLFENIIEEISCCDYLSHFESINEVKSVFKLIEEKIIKTNFLPDNLEIFRPWIDVMLFIQNYDLNPNKMFKQVLAILQPYEKEGLFTTFECIQKLVEVLKKKTDFVKNLDGLEKERKILKLQTQLYKNLISSLYTDEFFQETFELVNKDPDLWKFSAKIVDLLDDYTAFTCSISDSKGRIDKSGDMDFSLLKRILKDSKQKIALILLNKAFITLEMHNHSNYQEFLSENFDSFTENIFYFAKSIEHLKSNNPEGKVCPVAFMGVTVWLKVYLYFYSIALQKENNELEVLKDIDYTLCQDFLGLSTLKLYVIKNLRFRTNKPFKKLREEYSQRVFNWIEPLLATDSNCKSNLNIIPLSEIDFPDKSKQVDDLLKNLYNIGGSTMGKFLELCAKAKQDQSLLLCIFSWFVRLYMNNLQENFPISREFTELLEKHDKELSKNLGDMGIKFILLLLKNFDKDSYFYLHSKLTEVEVIQKLAALNVLMIFISQQFSGTALSSFMFKNNQFPENLSLHLNNQYLFGQLDNNFIVNNMKDVKIKIEERLRNKAIYADAMFIYKCGPKCEYFFYFDGCGRPTVQNPKKFCIVCGEEIGASAYHTAFPRHQKISIEEGFKYIDDYIQKFEERTKKGYLLNQMAENCKVDTKGNLKPITFRTLHFLLHTALFGLYEARFITKAEIDSIISIEENIDGPEYFKKHFLQDYKIIGSLLGVNNPITWLYKVLLDFKLLSMEKYEINNIEALAKFEKVFEERIILPAIQSVNTVLQDYTKRYIEYSKLGDEEDIIVYVDELKLDPKKYPVLEYFNYIKNPTFDDFHNQFSLLVGTGTHYPLLSFVLNKHKDLSKISSLHVIVEFTNYLKKKFDFRISREKATTSQMKALCENVELSNRFNTFKKKWNELKFTSVRVGCQEKKFQQINEESSLSLLLPNTHKDESGILLVGTMIALANLQNEFIYLSRIGNDSHRLIDDIVTENKDSTNLIQTIKTDHIINISIESILMDIKKNGYIHNYEYGKGKEIIYDFEEIESKLYEHANGKKLLDNEKFLLMNYQFELYPESASIITDIRRKNPQESLSQKDKILYKDKLENLSEKDLLDYLGSLDYVFTYLCNVKDDVNCSLEEFCRACISNYQDLNKYVIKQQPFSKIQLKHIIDFYETLEEVVFDKAFQDFIRPEFIEKISEEEKKNVLERFDRATLQNPNKALYPKLREIDSLSKVLKKIIVRVLGAQVNLENRLLEYFIREDMWMQDVDMNQIINIDLSDEIKLKHSYIILKHLKTQLLKLEPTHQEVEDQQIQEEKFYANNSPMLRKNTKNHRNRKVV